MCKLKKWMLAAILICGTSVFMACSSMEDNPSKEDIPSVKDGADLVVYGTKNMLQSSLVSNWLSHR